MVCFCDLSLTGSCFNRPLSEELKNYAREDTHYLLYIYARLRNALLDAASGHPSLLESVYKSSTEICRRRYYKNILTEDSHLELSRRSKKVFTGRQLRVLKEVYRWRDELARQEDESTGYVFKSRSNSLRFIVNWNLSRLEGLTVRGWLRSLTMLCKNRPWPRKRFFFFFYGIHVLNQSKPIYVQKSGDVCKIILNAKRLAEGSPPSYCEPLYSLDSYIHRFAPRRRLHKMHTCAISGKLIAPSYSFFEPS